MLKDVESGKVGCVAVKDASRLGRSLIDTGYYVEKYLPSRNIRFIAINDEYDSAKDIVDTKFMLKSMMNEAYSIDIGRKVRSVVHNKMKTGQFVGSRPHMDI
jgi:DNA invertase Pin-like site-specific DNA recombinase